MTHSLLRLIPLFSSHILSSHPTFSTSLSPPPRPISRANTVGHGVVAVISDTTVQAPLLCDETKRVYCDVAKLYLNLSHHKVR
jgi:hypothetical protein